MTTRIDYYFSDLSSFPFDGFFDDITETWQMLKKIKTVLKDGESFISPEAKIHPDATISGPVYIGAGCEIQPQAYVRPYTVLCENVVVGHGSEVKRSICLRGSKIASLSFVGDSILGCKARIGSGVITANRRFDQGTVSLSQSGEKISLRDDFYGIVLGDCSRLGANSVSQPGTHIGPYSWVYPLTNVRGFVARETRIYEKREFIREQNPALELK